MGFVLLNLHVFQAKHGTEYNVSIFHAQLAHFGMEQFALQQLLLVQPEHMQAEQTVLQTQLIVQQELLGMVSHVKQIVNVQMELIFLGLNAFLFLKFAQQA